MHSSAKYACEGLFRDDYDLVPGVSCDAIASPVFMRPLEASLCKYASKMPW